MSETSDGDKEIRPLAESDAVVERSDGTTVLRMESLQKGGRDMDAVLGQRDDQG